MSKFEEYDLYVRNKDFLVSDSVITFTDTDGKLLALKPDVTLSIIKNSHDLPGQTRKVCYDENVYRISENTHTFREIPQVGLECIGVVDRYQQSEVLYLAARSLEILSPDYLMDISHMAMLSGALELIDEDKALHDRVLRAIGEKNADAIRTMSREGCISEKAAITFIALLSCDGMLCDVLPTLPAICINDTMRTAAKELSELAALLNEDTDIIHHLRLDFSVVNSMSYYSGILFQGFIQGIPGSVLSGGQYDRLMHKMGRQAGAIGFAVHTDLLERLPEEHAPAFDADALLLYGENCDFSLLRQTVQTLTAQGQQVLTARHRPEKMTFRRILQFTEGRVETIETHH